VVIDRWIICRIRHFSCRRPREKQNTYFMFNNFIEKSHHLWEIVEKYYTVKQVRDGIMWLMDCVCWIAVARIQTDRLTVYSLCMATCYMFVPQHSVTCTSPVLVSCSLTVRTAAHNSKIKLQAVAPCAMRTAICVVAMKGWKTCVTVHWRDSSGYLYTHDIVLEYCRFVNHMLSVL